MCVEINDPDEHVVARVQRGEVDAYSVIIDRYAEKLGRYCRKFIANRDDIDDVVQDVFISSYKNIQSFDTSLRFSPWIYRVAHNVCINFLRKHGRITHIFDFDTFVSHYVYEDPAENERDRKGMRVLIDAGLEALKPKYREILILHYYEDMSYKDIADVLQIPIGTVGIRMMRAKEAIKNILNKKI